MDQERARIFRLLETADNFVKYAPPGRRARADERARARYERALELAERKRDEELIEQVRLRMSDLDRRASTPAAPLDDIDEPAVPAPMSPHERSEPQRPAGKTGDTPRRVPPGQRVTRGWPVLHEGPIPRFDESSWHLRIDGACRQGLTVTYNELKTLPNLELRSDFHCVTGWSKLDNMWTGVQTKILLERAEPLQEATHVVVHGEHGYTANLPLEVMMHDDVLVTWSHDGKDLAPEHGFPLRLLVPQRYGWKSVKWVRRIEVLTADRRGFWETRGYHNVADPWLEQRYSYQEV